MFPIPQKRLITARGIAAAPAAVPRPADPDVESPVAAPEPRALAAPVPAAAVVSPSKGASEARLLAVPARLRALPPTPAAFAAAASSGFPVNWAISPRMGPTRFPRAEALPREEPAPPAASPPAPLN